MSNKKDKTHYIEPEVQKASEAASEPIEIPVPDETLEAPPALEEVKKALSEAQSQAAEYKDGWQRALADFQNYKRRTDAEKAETYQLAVGNIVKRYLPILDDLERALGSRPEDQPWVDGIELVLRKLQSIVENEGVKRIEAEGQVFDPNFHEAISQETAEGVESGRIIAVVQNGYMLGERVIRPAQVRVAQ